MKHQQHHRPRAATPSARTTLAAALTLAMPILAAQPAFAQPGLVVDPNAANRPGLGAAPNGTPIVDINAPDASGISTNRFTDYNVGSKGLVLNNSVNRTNTQLAGSIDGNAQLGGRSAQVILNQVTGGNASVLAGATEVAGQQARVIVANPNGISVNGASFINASRVSLVAGTTEFDEDGHVARFRTENGRITIDGAGLDARNLDQLDLVSRSLKVNAALHAKKLVAVAQQGTAAIENPRAMSFDASTSGELPRVAIDVSRLGSVHGEDSIVMRGTSAGVGINISGKVEAFTGSMTLLSDGRVQVSNGGSLSAGTLSAPSGLQYGGNWTDDDEATKPPVAPEPPVAETKPPVDPEPPVAETKPPVAPEPPVAETKPPVDPEPPVAETKPPVDPEPPVAETKPPVDPEPPVAETKPPVDPEPPVAETKPPVDPEPPVAETKPPVDPEPPVAETKPPVDPEPPIAETNPKLVVDPNAANRPGLGAAPNGTPIVDINAPDASGISSNRFLDYNVGSKGLVLNNSVNRANTQLAGSIDGNAQLGGRSAQVILNQVTGGNASVLAGATEVAGQQARVIVANPNGISVNGASFINASRVSLVAGTTEFDEDGRIARFRTENGRIAIEGAGLDARNANQLDLVARGLKVDAAVRAKKLVAIAHQGTAAIEQSNRQTLSGPASGKAPAAAIDVSESGSLRADEIALIGASAKTGVRIAGTVDASAGSVSLASSGKATIESSGRLQAQTLSVLSALDNHGTVSGGTVDVAGRLDNDGSVQGRSVRIAGNVTNAGTFHSDGALEIDGRLTNDGADGVVSGHDVRVMGNVVNKGTVSGAESLKLMGALNNSGTLEARDVQVMGSTTNNGTLRAEKLLSAMGNVINRGTIEAGDVKVMGNVTNNGTLHGGDSVFVTGRLYNGLSGVTSSYGNVSSLGRVSGPGRIVSYMVRPSPADDVR
ncbi:filamentous hemagglutinin N-terminal domain-containing protein [Burkholderia pyrrocinia]|uniref:two-partner secretion domain-containing protein n=1 Tax=Burkholderia pyrrocinia TaxID=60550 RepID=UPI001576DF9D|nr:filamentous hemagglutinin N-terminal domain-containing protein [Burkholderia pyrrocinia]NTX29097.1 filamentous hemagglutinin N-terminal domain-containing protein [Burkholderia pyrrocinia]